MIFNYMKNWSYKELVEAIVESYELGLDQGRSELQTIGGISEDFFFYPKEDNLMENLVTLTQILRLCIKNLNYVFEGTRNIFEEQLSLVSEELLSKELTQGEITELKSEVDYVLSQLKLVEIRKA